MPPRRPPSAALTGMGLMLLAALCGAGVNACYRAALREGLPVPLVPFARGLITLGFLLPWILRSGPLAALSTRRPRLHLARGAAGIATFLLQLIAILLLPLADAVAMMSARPLWVLPLAALLLHEKIRRDRALAAGIGFLGVLIIAQPGGSLSLGTPAALAAGLCSGLVLITFKALSATEPPARVVAWYAMISVLFWGPVSAFVWQTPSLFALLMLLGGTVFALGADLAASAAARRAEVGLLAPVEYAQIPASAAIGWAVYAERPGWELLAGTLAMLAATLYLVRRGR
ncbi:DMT family transporter [Pseudoroseomonas cervicalis]|uniref:DMT family transporter n=1 Tax=Teichococcus cervicalis TaxID=204525 RepID=UPI0022F1B6B2|nr:DMT family transporter [Pseudoroseomonas cervicalis]WBV42028.1 DMT family transporter [Pseudoroseomonas cervicalis]